MRNASCVLSIGMVGSGQAARLGHGRARAGWGAVKSMLRSTVHAHVLSGQGCAGKLGWS